MIGENRDWYIYGDEISILQSITIEKAPKFDETFLIRMYMDSNNNSTITDQMFKHQHAVTQGLVTQAYKSS